MNVELANDAHTFRELRHSKGWELLCTYIERHRENALMHLTDSETTDTVMRYWQGVYFGVQQAKHIPDMVIAEYERAVARERK